MQVKRGALIPDWMVEHCRTVAVEADARLTKDEVATDEGRASTDSADYADRR